MHHYMSRKQSFQKLNSSAYWFTINFTVSALSTLQIRSLQINDKYNLFLVWEDFLHYMNKNLPKATMVILNGDED